MADITSSTYTPVSDSQGADRFVVVRAGQVVKVARSGIAALIDERAKAINEAGGTTANRPANPDTFQTYFDSTLGIPIWYNGTEWVDATGSTV